MRSLKVITIVGISIACLAVIVVYIPKARVIASPVPVTTLQRTAAPAWPADQTFSWTYPAPPDWDTKSGIWLGIRRSDLPLPPKGQGVILYGPQEVAVEASKAQAEFGTSLVSTPVAPFPQSGTATVQLFDLKGIGAVSVQPGKTLRVLAKNTFASASSGLSSDDVILPAGSFAGTTWRDTGRWENKELYLMSFYVQGDQSVYKYDVLLEETAKPAAQ